MHLPRTYETDAYISEAGFFCIRQPSEVGDPDPVVMLSIHQLMELKKAIPGFLRLMREQEDE